MENSKMFRLNLIKRHEQQIIFHYEAIQLKLC